MNKIAFVLLAVIFTINAASQQIVDLDEKTPYNYNGLEYGYYISNESSKEIKGEDFDRYELNLYVNNKSGCLKLIPFKAATPSSGSARSCAAAATTSFTSTSRWSPRSPGMRSAASATCPSWAPSTPTPRTSSRTASPPSPWAAGGG